MHWDHEIDTIPAEVRLALINYYGEIKEYHPASGGCINHGGRLKTDSKQYFIKWNKREKFPAMFQAEKKGLELLSLGNCIKVPEVEEVIETQDWQVLIMEFIESGSRTKFYQENLAHSLACVHRRQSSQYGLDHSNFMGSLPQLNIQTASLAEFFIESRLEPQVEMALKSGNLDHTDELSFQKLYKKLDSLLYTESPCLIHGDLWNGNVMTDTDGMPVLIDPAVTYGHREMDLAMTRLFGGFNNEFYQVYLDEFPLPPGMEKRWDIYSLYPLLIHVNIFGGGYVAQVRSILRMLF